MVAPDIIWISPYFELDIPLCRVKYSPIQSYVVVCDPSNHWQLDSLFNNLFRLTSALLTLGEENPPVTGGFPSHWGPVMWKMSHRISPAAVSIQCLETHDHSLYVCMFQWWIMWTVDMQLQYVAFIAVTTDDYRAIHKTLAPGEFQ